MFTFKRSSIRDFETDIVQLVEEGGKTSEFYGACRLQTVDVPRLRKFTLGRTLLSSDLPNLRYGGSSDLARTLRYSSNC